MYIRTCCRLVYDMVGSKKTILHGRPHNRGKLPSSIPSDCIYNVAIQDFSIQYFFPLPLCCFRGSSSGCGWGTAGGVFSKGAQSAPYHHWILQDGGDKTPVFTHGAARPGDMNLWRTSVKWPFHLLRTVPNLLHALIFFLISEVVVWHYRRYTIWDIYYHFTCITLMFLTSIAVCGSGYICRSC